MKGLFCVCLRHIKEENRMELIKDLEWRGIIYQQTDETGLTDLLEKEK